jgi:hypothetical protein
MGELADLMEVDITTIRRREKKAVSLISGYLNMRLSQLKSNNHAGLY